MDVNERKFSFLNNFTLNHQRGRGVIVFKTHYVVFEFNCVNSIINCDCNNKNKPQCFD